MILEHGNIRHSVNFPEAALPRVPATSRIAIANSNVPNMVGQISTRLAEAGCALGQAWQPLLKFMQPARARAFTCGAHCMLGCRCGAKWNAAEWVDQAVEAGATFHTEAHVTSLTVANRRIEGVRGKRRGRPFEASAPRVVLACRPPAIA